MNADSRNANEKDLYIVFAENTETKEKSFETLESANTNGFFQQSQSSILIPQSDVSQDVTEIMVVSEPSSERVDKDPN